MTKIRCQKCGGENLHSEGAILIVCNDCGNKTYIIPEEAVTEIAVPIDSDIVTIKYNRKQTDCPRRSICVNDTMNPGDQPCKVCNVVRHQYQMMTQSMNDTYNKREEYLKNHPELEDEVKDERELIDRIKEVVKEGSAEQPVNNTNWG